MNYKTVLLLLWGFALSLNFSYAQYTAVPEKTDLQISKVDLNGKWHFDPAFSGKLFLARIKGNEWANIKVPGEWTMQGFSVEPGKRGTYFRTFVIPAEWKDKEVFLRCDAVFSKAEIFVNGKNAGSHSGPMTAFEKDVTRLLKFGKENTITMGITAETPADTLMSGTQYAAHQLGGILRKIYLFAVPKTYISVLAVVTDLDEKYEDAVLKISASVENSGKQKDAVIEASLFSPAGTPVELKNSSKEIPLTKGESKNIELKFRINKPLKWDAEHPNLYRLELTLSSGAGNEKIVKKIGFREIRVVGNQVFVNGKPIKLRGVNRHETHALLGRSLTPELWEKDAKLFREANVNYIRTSHYPPAEEFIEWCDSLGLYVELENPFCWIGHGANIYWNSHDPKNPVYYTYFEKIARSNIGFFRNHPSVLMWSMANESMWNENWSKLADYYSTTDPTRPATFHDQAYGGYNNYGSTKMPVANMHYPGPSGPEVAEDFPRPLLFGEYAHLNTYNRTEIVTDPGVRDAWGRGFKKMWEKMYKSRGNLGGAIWSGIDDVFYLPDGRVVGYGEWGPLDSWRRKKPEYYHMKKVYSPVKIHNLKIKTPKQSEPVLLQVENRFDFTDLNECSITWSVDNKKGTASINLPTHQSGILEINPGIKELEGKIMTVSVYSPLGFEVNSYDIEIGNVKRDNFPFETISPSVLSSKEKNGILTINAGEFFWVFDMKNGMIKNSGINGEDMFTGGAVLMILSLTTGECKTEHSLHIPFHNETCTGHSVSNTSWEANGDTLRVFVDEEYDQAKGKTVYTFTNDGKLMVDYNFTSKVNINPRQWGMIFTTSPQIKELKWYRKGLWSKYPDDHIGRINGEAVPFEKNVSLPDPLRHEPGNEWRYDANKLGSNDFRSTKEDIYWASLTNSKGKGAVILSSGNQSFRAFANENGSISFLVADFSTGGGDMFFSSHYSDERKKITEGSKLKGEVTIQLINGFK